MPEDLPEYIEVNISALGVGHTIHVSNLPQQKGIVYKTPAEDVVVSCTKIEEEETESTETTEVPEAAAEGESKKEEEKK